MKFIQIRDEAIEPGGLVEWTPYVPGGLGTWAEDARLTSHNHEQHLRSAADYRARTQREGGRESWLGLAIEFDEPLSIPAIRATLTQWIDRHEVLRSHVILEDHALRRLTTVPGSVKLRMGRIGWYNQSGPLVEQLGGAFDRATAPLQWPAYMFATVGRERSFTLLFAADHSLVDGYSLIMGQQELVALYRAARDQCAPGLAEVGSYVDFSAAERRLADQNGGDHPAVRAWTEFLCGGRGGMPSVLDHPPLDHPPPADRVIDGDDPDPDVSAPQESLSGTILDDEATNRFTAVCSEAGGTLTAGVLAAFALVYHQLSGDPEFRCILPRHTRDDRQWLASLGWFVALAPFSVDMSDSPTFDQTVVRATESLKHGRQGATMPFLRVAELLGHTGAPRFVISFIDTRYAPGAAIADAGRAKVIRSHSYATDEVYLWINRTPSGMRYSARFPRESPVGAPTADPDITAPGVNNSTPASVDGHRIDPRVGPVHAYLHAFTELIHDLGDESTFAGDL